MAHRLDSSPAPPTRPPEDPADDGYRGAPDPPIESEGLGSLGYLLGLEGFIKGWQEHGLGGALGEKGADEAVDWLIDHLIEVDDDGDAQAPSGPVDAGQPALGADDSGDEGADTSDDDGADVGSQSENSSEGDGGDGGSDDGTGADAGVGDASGDAGGVGDGGSGGEAGGVTGDDSEDDGEHVVHPKETEGE